MCVQPSVSKSTAKEDEPVIDHGGIAIRFKTEGQQIGLNVTNTRKLISYVRVTDCIFDTNTDFLMLSKETVIY